MTTPEPSYRTIQLTQGQVALVSAHRFEEFNAFKWHALWYPGAQSFYAVRNVRLPTGKWTLISMHRTVLGLKYGDKRHGDHANHNALDNRDENLRIATVSQNLCNRGAQRNNTSGFKGVTWDRVANKWRAQIKSGGKMKHLGAFDDLEIAHAAYVSASTELHGLFGRS